MPDHEPLTDEDIAELQTCLVHACGITGDGRMVVITKEHRKKLIRLLADRECWEEYEGNLKNRIKVLEADRERLQSYLDKRLQQPLDYFLHRLYWVH